MVFLKRVRFSSFDLTRMVATIGAIIKAAKSYLPSLSEERVLAAYEFAKKAHEGQVRFSGEPYVTHPLAAAKNLLPLKPDEDTLVACLLHDVPGDTPVPIAEIEKKFGKDVSSLVDSVEKMSLVKVRHGESEMDSWRKMFLAMAKDLRAVFIRLADRLHNMQTLEYVAAHKQQRIAEETLYVYAPIASRLGIYSVKSQLEDLCFKNLHPREYESLSKQLKGYGRVRQEYMDKAREVMEEFLDEEGIPGRVSGRIKHLYSIYRKLQRKNASSLDSIYDLFAMRIILPDQHRESREFVGHCYTMLGAIHNEWTPVPGRFKDYIAVPKINGYRSLHTTVIGKRIFVNQPVEIQIRTESMNQEAEFGVASHWWYDDDEVSGAKLSRHEVQEVLEERRLVSRFYDFLEEHPDKRSQFEKFLSSESGRLSRAESQQATTLLKKAGFSMDDVEQLRISIRSPKVSATLKPFQQQVDWLYGLDKLQEELQKSSSIPEEGEEVMGPSVDIFSDRIFVLTPNGDVKDLPQGSTSVDFAYSIHTDVGNRCYQAKVNGSIVKLDHELSSGDVVEIVTRKNMTPNRYWLSFVKTDMARTKIKASFRNLDREKNVKAGRELINKELRRLDKPLLGPNYRLLKKYAGKKYDFSERETIVESVGNGSVTVNSVIRNLFSEKELLGEKHEHEGMHTPTVDEAEDTDLSEILITGEANLPVVLAGCCKPKYPNKIIGFVTRGKTIRVHKKSCSQLSGTPQERLLSASWAQKSSDVHYQIEIRIEGKDRVGFLHDILEVVAAMNMSVVDFPLVSKKDERVRRNLIVEVPGYEQVAQLLTKLEAVSGIISVRKI